MGPTLKQYYTRQRRIMAPERPWEALARKGGLEGGFPVMWPPFPDPGGSFPCYLGRTKGRKMPEIAGLNRPKRSFFRPFREIFPVFVRKTPETSGCGTASTTNLSFRTSRFPGLSVFPRHSQGLGEQITEFSVFRLSCGRHMAPMAGFVSGR